MNSSEAPSPRSRCPRKSLFHTPEKLAPLPRRGRSANHSVALSINEVRKVAESLNERSPSKSVRPNSARRQIESWPDESPVRKPKKPAGEPVKLPERYEILVEFLDSLDSSIRLLRLRGLATTFTNICPKIESLTDRRFSYGHLAQLKFILHEALEIKKINVFDERTSCMKPDLRISINMDAIDDNGKSKSESASMHLRKVFRSRLVDFSKSHPEVEEIPEETLPSPFNRPKLGVHLETCIPGDKIPDGKELDAMDNGKGSTPEIADVKSTPAKLASTPARLWNVNPELHPPHPPKRCYMSPEDQSPGSSNKLVRRPHRFRSLKFDSPIKNESTVNEIDGEGGVSVGDDIFDILPKNVLQSIREKEKKAMEERDPAISQAKRRQKMIAGLPKLFDMIRFLFQSTCQSVITKEELIHKIVTNRLDIVDTREVTEQLNLLVELAPNWISEKLAFGGDSLFCINKSSCPESIRARLEEAK